MQRLLIILLLILPINSFADIYRWVDKNGTVVYSDQPHSNADRIDLPEIQTYSANPVVKDNNQTKPENSKPDTFYQSLIIKTPNNQQVIHDSSLAVNIMLEPSLSNGDQLMLLLDDKTAAAPPQENTTLTLQNINRGAHQLAAVVVNAQGKVLKTSATVVFYRYQASDLSNGVGGEG